LNEANRPDAVWIEGTAGVGGGWDWTEQSNLSVQLGGICNWSASARLGDSGPDSTWYDGTILALACFARLYSDDRHGTLDSSPVKRRPLSVPASGSSRRGHSSVRLSLNCQRGRHRAGMRSGGIALSVRPARFRGRPRRAAICPQASLPSSLTLRGPVLDAPIIPWIQVLDAPIIPSQTQGQSALKARQVEPSLVERNV
jgi:hypothetical protein